MRPHQARSLLASLALLPALGACEPGDPAGITGFKPPLKLEGTYAGTVTLSLHGSARSDSRSEPVQLELQPIDSIYNVKGTVKVATEGGRMEGTYIGRDSSIVVRLLGPARHQSLGWASFLTEILPGCEWSGAEVLTPTAKVDLSRFTLSGHVNAHCTDPSLHGHDSPGAVLIEAYIDVRRTNSDPGTVH